MVKLHELKAAWVLRELSDKEALIFQIYSCILGIQLLVYTWEYTSVK